MLINAVKSLKDTQLIPEVPVMKAMLFESKGKPLTLVDRGQPQPAAGQLLLQIKACGVCRTDLHIIDGELDKPKLPLVIGHEIVGTILQVGDGVNGFSVGQRVGVPWLGRTCGQCKFCLSDRENLCSSAKFTGYSMDGGYATRVVADSEFCFLLPDGLSDAEAAPLLCAGVIGWRTLKFAGDAKRIGVYGFGAAASIVIQVAISQGREVYGFTRDGDVVGQEFARKMGAVWAGGSSEMPPELLDAALIFAPVGELVPLALRASDKGATIVCGGIHMSDIPSFPYKDLWEERSIRSVANLTRQDALDFLDVAFKLPVRTSIKTYPLSQANQALDDLRHGRFNGAAVLTMPE
jgi:propanol-preferring alcohol dehydrogenase